MDGFALLLPGVVDGLLIMVGAYGGSRRGLSMLPRVLIHRQKAKNQRAERDHSSDSLWGGATITLVSSEH